MNLGIRTPYDFEITQGAGQVSNSKPDQHVAQGHEFEDRIRLLVSQLFPFTTSMPLQD